MKLRRLQTATECYAGSTQALLKADRDGTHRILCHLGARELTPRYWPRSKRDPLPWQCGGFRYRSTELWAEPITQEV